MSNADISLQSYGLNKLAYNVNEVIGLLSVGRTRLYRAIRSGHLRPTKMGRKTLFLAQDLAAFLDKVRNGEVS
jgi:excisionase family DNA binding protein